MNWFLVRMNDEKPAVLLESEFPRLLEARRRAQAMEGPSLYAPENTGMMLDLDDFLRMLLDLMDLAVDSTHANTSLALTRSKKHRRAGILATTSTG